MSLSVELSQQTYASGKTEKEIYIWIEKEKRAIYIQCRQRERNVLSRERERETFEVERNAGTSMSIYEYIRGEWKNREARKRTTEELEGERRCRFP